MDDVLAAWDAVDADVEEAADGDGEEEYTPNSNLFFNHITSSKTSPKLCISLLSNITISYYLYTYTQI